MSKKYNPRDISWLSFNGRVLQEAADPSVPLPMRLKFLGIFSNNLDEFFRVRVAGLKRASEIKDKTAMASFFDDPSVILEEVHNIVVRQQKKFDQTWKNVRKEMAKQNVFIRAADELSQDQIAYVKHYYSEKVESNIIPLLLDDVRPMPYLRDKSLYMGIAMKKSQWQYETKFAIIELPTRLVGRFLIVPSERKSDKIVVLLEDVIKVNLPHIFSYFGFDEFHAHAFKISKDADFDLDNDVNTTLVEKITKAVKNRRKGKPTRFVFDKNMDVNLVEFLIKKLNLSKKDSIIPGQKIHNFKHFMDFPNVFKAYTKPVERTAFDHPAFVAGQRVTDVITQKDILLSFPYHNFDPVIDLLREAAMDPDVKSIRVTIYRMATNSKIANALINASRNGKDVTVMVELRARFDEEHNLEWKDRFEMEGIEVLVGIPNKKVHAKLCVIKKRAGGKTIQYGFVSTGNINEKTAALYGDHCLMTSDRRIMADINKIFNALSKPKIDLDNQLSACKHLVVCPTTMRQKLVTYIDKEIAEVQAGRKGHMIIKVNSLSDKDLIKKLYEAAELGVEIDLIVRGIYCVVNQKRFKQPIRAISIIDEYLEHARVMYFYSGGHEHIFISSADWMTRNLDHRVEAAIRITDPEIKKQLKDILSIQLKDNVKARLLDETLSNAYVEDELEAYRSQVEIHHYLQNLPE